MQDDVAYRLAPMPESGSLRVHPDPAYLPRVRREAAPRNRFDDPEHAWAVRYSAQTLRGCLVETPAKDLELIDSEDPELLRDLNKHPSVHAALLQSGLGTKLTPVFLDAAIVRLGGPVGRPITQAVSRAVKEWLPWCDGIAYWSRLDPQERCWAIWDEVPVSITSEPLDPANPEHRAAVRSVSALYEIDLPDDWS